MTIETKRSTLYRGEAGLRAGMSTAAMLDRFARLNGLTAPDAMQHIVDASSASPFLRARLVADRLAAEGGARPQAEGAAAADRFFARWLSAHGLAAHPGVTWARVRTLGHPPVVLTLAAVARLRTRAELVRLDDDLRHAMRHLAVPSARSDGGIRGFADPARPWLQAGVLLSATRAWRWLEWEHLAVVLQRYGLRARFGLDEDQVSTAAASVPIVVWNPATAAVPIVGATTATVELRVVART